MQRAESCYTARVKIVVRNALLLALVLALPAAALLGQIPPTIAAHAICPAGHTRLQFTSSSTPSNPHAVNASTYCVTAGTYDGCTKGAGPCQRRPVSAFLAYAAIFAVGWVVALAPAFGIMVLRQRKRQAARPAADDRESDGR